jgi:glycine/sarcosine N-methyltransferase
MNDDPYSRVDYRRMVAWPERILREAPFLRKVLKGSPTPSVIDLGCGTGEHSRFLAEEGFTVVGLDRSESMLEKAMEEVLPSNLKFVLGEIQEVDRKLQERFGAAISLGNTLVHLNSDEALDKGFSSLSQIIENKGLFLFQILNYERIFTKRIRHLPVNFRPGEGDEEIVFLRLMELLEDGKVRFCPTTLKYHPECDPPLELVRSRMVELQGWRLQDLLPRLSKAGFTILETYGDLIGGPFEPLESHDLVVLAQLNH